MALVEEYYELNEAEVVSVVWKIIQIAVYLCAGCLGLWCGYIMAVIRISLDDKCYLYTSIKYDFKGGVVQYVDWESEFWCDYCQYTMVCSFIVATIWATFFLMCGKGGKSLTGLPQPWRIVFCSFIFNIIYFSVSLSASIKIKQGTEIFCGHKKHKGIKLEGYTKNCPPLNIIFSNKPKPISLVASQMETVVRISWCCSLAWLILILISFLRIVLAVDFRMYKICVFQIDETIHNKKEEVLKITNYEEPKKLHSASEDKMAPYFEKESEEDLENGKKQPVVQKKHAQFPSVRSQLKPNAAFYVTADIRMLDREKKRKKMKALDEVFDKNPIHRGKKFVFSDEVHLTLNDPGVSHSPRFLYRYSNLIFEPTGNKNDDEDDEISGDEQNQSANTAEGEDRRLSSDDSIPENRSVIFKKQV